MDGLPKMLCLKNALVSQIWELVIVYKVYSKEKWFLSLLPNVLVVTKKDPGIIGLVFGLQHMGFYKSWCSDQALKEG